MHRLHIWFLLLVVCCAPLFCQSPLTQIVDTITFPNGTHPNGTALISWARYTNDANPRQVIYPGSQTITITNGVLNVSLFPTAAMLPVGCFNVQYSLNGNRSVRFWYIPVSSTPVSLNIVESSIGCPPPSIGMIAPAQISNAGASVGNVLAWNGTFWAPAIGGGGGGGGTGSAIYTTAVSSQTSVTITAATHGEGAHPFAIAFRSSDGEDVQAVYNCKTSGGAPVGCADATSNGDIVFNFNPPFTGTIEIGGGGNGSGGGGGNFNANQILTHPITSLLGNSGILVQGIAPYTAGHLGSFDASGNLVDSLVVAGNTVSTTQTYADPTWITSLSTSKLAGALPCPQEPQFTGDVQKLAGSCATVVTTTNGTGFSPSATIDATNGNNITGGTIAGAFMAAVNLASSANGGVFGNLPVGNLCSGVGASSTTFLRGDCVWTTVAGAGSVTNSSGPLFAGQLLIGNGSNDAKAIGTLGSTNTMYHGNAGGTGSFLPATLTTDVAGILPGANGGTNNGFLQFSGPAGSLKTYTGPNANATLLTSNAAVTMQQGGTGADFSSIVKGGILSGSGSGTLGITVAGVNGQVLSANSAQPGGVQWITNSAGTGTITSVTCTVPLTCTPNPITSTGTLTAPTVVTSAAALTLNALVLGGGLQASSTLGSLGTTTTVLHGNIAGPPAYAAVGLATDVTGTLPLVNGGLGITTGSQLNYLRVAPNITTPTLQFSALPSVNSADYNFPAQTPGGSLSAGASTITLTPCPLGVNGTLTPGITPYFYISGGTGTNEAAPQTAGTCTPGASSGTVILTIANSHTGAWTIQSASAGIQEALNSCGLTACTVSLPAGAFTIYGPIGIPQATSIQEAYNIVGAGRRTTLLNVASTFPLTVAGVFIPAFNSGLTFAPPGFSLRDFGVVFIQNYALPLASFTQWPPVVFANGISGGRVNNFYVSGAWQGFVLRGTAQASGQWIFDDIDLDAYGPGGIDIDGFSDTVAMHAIHWFPFINQNVPGGYTHVEFNPAVVGLAIGGAASVILSDSYFLTGTSIKFTGSAGASAIAIENTGFDVFGIIDMSRASGGVSMTISNCFFFQDTNPGGTSFAAPSASIVYGPTAPELTITNSILYHSSATQPLVSVTAPTASNGAFGQFNFLNNLVYDSSNNTATASLFTMSGSSGNLEATISGNTISYEFNLTYTNPMLSISGSIGLSFENNVNAGYGSGTWLSIASDSFRHRVSGNKIPGQNAGWTVSLPTSKLLGVYQDQTFDYNGQTPAVVVSSGTTTVGNYGRLAVFFCNATSGALQFNLPLATSVGYVYTVVKTDSSANACSIVPAGADTINGAASQSTNTPYGKFRVQSDGISHWFIE